MPALSDTMTEGVINKWNFKVGDKVKMRQNRQVGIVKEIKGKKAVLQVGIMPMTVLLEDLTIMKDKEIKE